MAVSLTTRLGLHRWSADTDPWARTDFDSDNAALEDLVVMGTQGLNASRPAAGVQRRLYTAADAERVYIDDGDEWYEFGMLATANTWIGAQKFAGQIDAAGGIASSVGALSLADDVAVGGNLVVAGNFDGGGITTLTNPFTPSGGTLTATLRKQGKRVQGHIICNSISSPGAAIATWNSPGGAPASLWMPPAGQEAVLRVVGFRNDPAGTIASDAAVFGAVPSIYLNSMKVINTGAVELFAQISGSISPYAIVYAGSWLIA